MDSLWDFADTARGQIDSMTTAYQIVLCTGIVPDPLQTLETVRRFTIADRRFTI
jgi:hypothetical protein